MRNLLFALVISMSVGLVPFCEVSAAENTTIIKFDSDKWSKCQNREAIANELVKSHSLIGMTREHLHKLLGYPYTVDQKEFFPFKGIRDGSNGGDYRNILPCLEIRYFNNKIQDALIGIHEFGNTLPEGAPIPAQN